MFDENLTVCCVPAGADPWPCLSEDTDVDSVYCFRSPAWTHDYKNTQRLTWEKAYSAEINGPLCKYSASNRSAMSYYPALLKDQKCGTLFILLIHHWLPFKYWLCNAKCVAPIIRTQNNNTSLFGVKTLLEQRSIVPNLPNPVTWAARFCFVCPWRQVVIQ